MPGRPTVGASRRPIDGSVIHSRKCKGILFCGSPRVVTTCKPACAGIVVDFLIRQGVPVVAGDPVPRAAGHLRTPLPQPLGCCIRTVQVMHEQAAVHLADGFYRATGRPILAFTSIGPGATNTVIGMATAYVDSTAVALLTGSPHTYMRARASSRNSSDATSPTTRGSSSRSSRSGGSHRASTSCRSSCTAPGTRWSRAGPVRSSSTCRWTSWPTRPRSPSPTLPSARRAGGSGRPPTTSSGRRRSFARPNARSSWRVRWRRDHGRGLGRSDGPRRTARRPGGHHLERQGRHRRDPRAGRADHRRYLGHLGQRPRLRGRRHPLGGQRFTGLVGVPVSAA